MKTFNIFLLVIIGTLSISATNCIISPSTSSKDDKDVKKEVRTVEKFTGIDLSVSADVKLSQGTSQKVEIEASTSDLEKIITEKEGSKLVIKTKPGTWHVGRVIVYVTMEQINDLSISGSGSINNETPIVANKLRLDISGSGSILISDLKAEEISSEVSGSGSIKLSGKEQVSMHKMEVSGSGDIYVNELKTADVNVNISGSGTCKVFATEKLRVDVSGSGDVYYVGKPVINADVSGSGKVKELKM